MFQQTSTNGTTVRPHTHSAPDLPTGSALAHEAMEAANWNIEDARAALVARCESDPRIADEAQRAGVDQWLSTLASAQRRSLFLKAVPAGKDDTSALRRMAETSILDTFYVGSVRLGDCSPNELREAIAARKSAAKTHERNAAFLTAILKKLKPTTKRVRDEMNDDDARRIARKFPC